MKCVNGPGLLMEAADGFPVQSLWLVNCWVRGRLHVSGVQDLNPARVTRMQKFNFVWVWWKTQLDFPKS